MSSKLNSKIQHSIAELGVDLPDDWQTTIADIQQAERDVQPWYIRTMVGIGAWIASLFLIGFITSLSLLAADTAFIVIGVGFIVSANILYYKVKNDFMFHITLAFSLAGQILIAMGVEKLVHMNEVAAICTPLILCNIILFFTFRDLVHRFLSVSIIITCLTFLIYEWKVQHLLTYLVPALSFCFAWLVKNQHRTRLQYNTLAPLASALMMSTFGMVMLSTLYVLPELSRNFSFFPSPWIATVGIALVTLYVLVKTLPGIFMQQNRLYEFSLYALIWIVMLCSLNAPGIMFAVLVMLLGVTYGHKVYSSIGIALLSVFTISYFYGIETSLLVKSYTLVATGAALLAGRWWLSRCINKIAGSTHA